MDNHTHIGPFFQCMYLVSVALYTAQMYMTVHDHIEHWRHNGIAFCADMSHVTISSIEEQLVEISSFHGVVTLDSHLFKFDGIKNWLLSVGHISILLPDLPSQMHLLFIHVPALQYTPLLAPPD